MIRPIRPDDADGIAALIRSAFAAIAEPLDPPSSASKLTEASILDHLEHGGGAVFEHDALLGCVLWREEDGLYISRLATLPAARRQGIAARLMHAAEAEAHRLGLPRIHLGIRLVIQGNRRFYARLGFIETGEHAHDGYDHPTWVAAEKRLVRGPA